MAITSHHTPEVFGVVFRCAHGNFFIRSRELFGKLHGGDKVTVTYREIAYCDRHEKCTLVDYDFLDAELRS